MHKVRVFVIAFVLLVITTAPVLADVYGGPWPSSHRITGVEWTR